MNWLKHLFASIAHIFQSPRLATVATTIENLVPLAVPIVQDIAAITPNKTVQQVAAAYQKYGVPLAQGLGSSSGPVAIGNALLNLATEVLQKNHAPTAAVSLLNTAVQLALVGLKSVS